MSNEINPYICKITGATFSKPCTVTSCFAHVQNLNSSVNVNPITNCAHVDFNLNGFNDSISYAVEEQGFVGYRDLQYMAPFLNVHYIKLREIYSANVDLFRKALAVVWLLKNYPTNNYCKNCGHPIKEGRIECTSVSLCAERKEAVNQVIEPIKSVLDGNIVNAYNLVWRSLTEKFPLTISLTDSEKQTLSEL